MFHKRKISWTNWGETLPTDEDLFDINLSSIVSDVRHILMGNLTPRSYAEFAPVWQEEEYLGRVPRYKRPDSKLIRDGENAGKHKRTKSAYVKKGRKPSKKDAYMIEMFGEDFAKALKEFKLAKKAEKKKE